MKYSLVLLSFSALVLFACQPSGDSNQQAPASLPDSLAPPPKPQLSTGNISEDDLVMRLSADLIGEPQSLAEKDQNAIINYAIDNLLDVYRTNSGLYYQIKLEGEGEQLRWGDRVEAHYRAYTLDGKEVDNTYKRARPLKFYIGNMIDGFNEGLQFLKPRGKALFILPSELAYGEGGVQLAEDDYLVPPNAIIVFEVEVTEKL